MNRYKNKTLDKIIQRLTNNGELMVDLKTSYSERHIFGANTVGHTISLKSDYRFDGECITTGFYQLADLVDYLKTEKIYRLSKPEYQNSNGFWVQEYQRDSNNKIIDFNPFTNIFFESNSWII